MRLTPYEPGPERQPFSPESLKDSSIPVAERMLTAVKQVYDPEIPINIYDLGLIYKLDFDPASGKATVLMTLTTPNCPEAQSLPHYVRKMIESIPEVTEADVEITWEPAWNRDMMSDAAKLQLGLM